MNPTRKKNPNGPEAFPLEKLSFYFDQVERDRMDTPGSSGRTHHVMQIRNHLLNLPEGQFLPTLQAIRSILQGVSSPDQDKKDRRAGTTAQSLQKLLPPSLASSKTAAFDGITDRSEDEELEEPPAAVVRILQTASPADPSDT